MHVKSVFTTLLLLCLIGQIFGQLNLAEEKNPDNLPVQAFVAMPTLFGVQVENTFKHRKKYKTQAGDEVVLPLQDGQQYSIFGSVPVFKTKNGLKGKVSFAYDYYRDDFGVATFNEQQIINEAEESFTSAYAAFSLSKKVPLKKWNKLLILSGSFTVAGKQYYKLNTFGGTISANVPLKINRNSMLTVGLTSIIGGNISIPVIPTVAYFTKLNDKLNLELILPISASLRYMVSPKTTFAGGVKFGPRTPYLDNDLPSLQTFDDVLEFRNNNIRFFTNAEQALGKFLWINAEVGYSHAMQSTLNEPNVDKDDFLLKGSGFGNMYLKAGIFLRPVFPVGKF